MDNIDQILQADTKTILRLILEQMDDWQVARIRAKIAPHWADGKYGTWKHTDRLFTDVFESPILKCIPVREQLTGDRSNENVSHAKCKLCGEYIICDRNYHDARYTHLFADCGEIAKLRKESSSENEFRTNILKTLESQKSPHYYDCSIGRTGKCDCAYGS